MPDLIPAPKPRALTAKQFGDLADVPPELEWLANITNPKTRRAYKEDVNDFFHFAGLRRPVELRGVTRAHVIAWRKDLEVRQLSAATIRRKLSALSSLYDYLCERNAVAGNPVDGVKRPLANGNEGSTPALGDAQARKLLEAPPGDTLKRMRDRAILATLLYHGLRQQRRAMIALAPVTLQRIPDCLSRSPMLLQAASTTPEPTKRPWRRNSAYRIRFALVVK